MRSITCGLRRGAAVCEQGPAKAWCIVSPYLRPHLGGCLISLDLLQRLLRRNLEPDLGIKKILIVDWDVHHGNGTQKMFYSDPRVLFFSVHRFDYGSFYPAEGDASHCFIGEGAGTGYNINMPWEHGKCGDADYIAAWDHVLLPVTEAFDPDIISVSAGFDAVIQLENKLSYAISLPVLCFNPNT